jgi:hypothetical protein
LPATAAFSPQVKPHYGVQTLSTRILRSLQKANRRRKCRWQNRQTSESSSSSSSVENVVPFFQENLASPDRQVRFDSPFFKVAS